MKKFYVFRFNVEKNTPVNGGYDGGGKGVGLVPPSPLSLRPW